ncbi:unnamed protein product [Owenia fusiformis]|uniref:Uncharacterized protein n=1 Tax=Owenia fusiformis TaxID=6347 RepID=A0A8J1TX83_OWEFU|nr:unnamed protein product [Owenia fusiformis]
MPRKSKSAKAAPEPMGEEEDRLVAAYALSSLSSGVSSPLEVSRKTKVPRKKADKTLKVNIPPPSALRPSMLGSDGRNLTESNESDVPMYDDTDGNRPSVAGVGFKRKAEELNYSKAPFIHVPVIHPNINKVAAETNSPGSSPNSESSITNSSLPPKKRKLKVFEQRESSSPKSDTEDGMIPVGVEDQNTPAVTTHNTSQPFYTVVHESQGGMKVSNSDLSQQPDAMVTEPMTPTTATMTHTNDLSQIPSPDQQKSFMMDPKRNLMMIKECHMAITPDEDGDLPIHIAVVHGNHRAVLKLINLMKMQGETLDRKNALRQTPLHLAILTEEPQIVSCLIQNGAGIRVLDRYGQTSLHLAVSRGSPACLDAIIETSNDLPINEKDFEGRTPLHLAIETSSGHIVRRLIKAGANVNVVDGKSGRSPIFYAVEANQQHLVEMLLQAGCYVNLQNYSGNTPLHCASGHGFSNLIQMLMKYGADPYVKNHSGDSCLSLAKTKPAFEAMQKPTSPVQPLWHSPSQATGSSAPSNPGVRMKPAPIQVQIAPRINFLVNKMSSYPLLSMAIKPQEQKEVPIKPKASSSARSSPAMSDISERSLRIDESPTSDITSTSRDETPGVDNAEDGKPIKEGAKKQRAKRKKDKVKNASKDKVSKNIRDRLSQNENMSLPLSQPHQGNENIVQGLAAYLQRGGGMGPAATAKLPIPATNSGNAIPPLRLPVISAGNMQAILAMMQQGQIPPAVAETIKKALTKQQEQPFTLTSESNITMTPSSTLTSKSTTASMDPKFQEDGVKVGNVSVKTEPLTPDEDKGSEVEKLQAATAAHIKSIKAQQAAGMMCSANMTAQNPNVNLSVMNPLTLHLRNQLATQAQLQQIPGTNSHNLQMLKQEQEVAQDLSMKKTRDLTEDYGNSRHKELIESGRTINLTKSGRTMDLTESDRTMDLTKAGHTMELTKSDRTMDLTESGRTMDLTESNRTMNLTESGHTMDLTKLNQIKNVTTMSSTMNSTNQVSSTNLSKLNDGTSLNVPDLSKHSMEQGHSKDLTKKDTTNTVATSDSTPTIKTTDSNVSDLIKRNHTMDLTAASATIDLSTVKPHAELALVDPTVIDRKLNSSSIEPQCLERRTAESKEDDNKSKMNTRHEAHNDKLAANTPNIQNKTGANMKINGNKNVTEGSSNEMLNVQRVHKPSLDNECHSSPDSTTNNEQTINPSKERKEELTQYDSEIVSSSEQTIKKIDRWVVTKNLDHIKAADDTRRDSTEHEESGTDLDDLPGDLVLEISEPESESLHQSDFAVMKKSYRSPSQ